MSHIVIDAEMLEMAMDDHSGMCEHYLDKKTGEVIHYSQDYGGDFDMPGENATFAELLDRDPGRFVYIEPMESHDAFRIMEDFVMSLPDGEDKRLLEKVLSWKKPFSNFKSALYDMGPLRDQWFEFHSKRMIEESQQWIEDEQLDAELFVRKINKNK